MMPTAIRLGAMIETPAAAWRIAEIAERVDFLSVGGNDLAQFYFAADRDSELTRGRYDPLETGFLSFMAAIAEKARKAGKPLTFCGEQASDVLMGAALVGVGVTRFSSSASAIGPFRRLVRSINASAVSEWLKERFKAGSPRLRREFAEMLKRAGAAL
jgi:phosphotransferase system enzyme I (PtsP)